MSAATKRIRSAVFARADGACEACGKHITEESGHLDHFFGRAKVEQSASNCWALCLTCDDAKTNSRPTASAWLGRFIAHCVKHGFEAEQSMAQAKLLTLIAKGRAPAQERAA